MLARSGGFCEALRECISHLPPKDGRLRCLQYYLPLFLLQLTKDFTCPTFSGTVAMAPDFSLRSVNVFSLLGARDSCSDAFGPNASNSDCRPSDTLCCKHIQLEVHFRYVLTNKPPGVRRGQEFPSCQQHLGKGWCCVGKLVTLSTNPHLYQP
jgi:hypothetical protein